MEDTKKCKYCQEMIDKKAKRCPKCQGDLRSWFSKHPILTGIIILFVIVVFGASSSGNKNGDNSGSTEITETNNQPQTEIAKANTPTPVPAIAEEIDVDKLADDFDSNQVAAEANWKDKLVTFSAEIANITETGLSFSNIGSKEFSMTQVSCKVSDKNQLMEVKNGETVKVKGVVGKQFMGVIELSKCEIVK